MAEDRGGLRYPLEVTDGFSKPFSAFVDRVKAAEKAWAGLQTTVGKPLGVGRALAREAEAESRARGKAASATEAQARAMGQVARDGAQAARAAERAAKAGVSDRADLRARAAEAEARARTAAAQAAERAARAADRAAKAGAADRAEQVARAQAASAASAEREAKARSAAAAAAERAARAADAASRAGAADRADVRAVAAEAEARAKALIAADSERAARAADRAAKAGAADRSGERARLAAAAADAAEREAKARQQATRDAERAASAAAKANAAGAADRAKLLAAAAEREADAKRRAAVDSERAAKAAAAAEKAGSADRAKLRADAAAREADAKRRVAIDSERAARAAERAAAAGQADAAAFAARQRRQASDAAARAVNPASPTDLARQNLLGRLGQLQLRQAEAELLRLDPTFKALNDEMARTTRTGDSLLFTFRRLIGVFAAFAAIRAVASGFQQAVAGAISFNASLEQTRAGIASLILAANRLVDIQSGRQLEGAEAFAAAQQIATRQLGLLRKEALRTAATFEELAFAYQVALAPGAKAGLQLDEIRKLTVRVSQAASAIGLEQNQLSEEIRAILTGTIDPRTTRLGVIPGLDNESIKRAQTAGKLAEFLEKKLFAFALAADAAQQNFKVLASNLQEAFSLASAEGSLALFQELKRLLQDMSRLLIVDIGNAVTPNSQVVQAISEVASGLRTGVLEARRLVAALSAQDLINIARSIGQAFSVAFSLLGPVVEGLVRALGNVAGVLNPLLAGLGLVAEGSSGILATLVEWYVYYRLSSAALDGMVVKTGLLGKSTGAVLLNVAKIAAFLGAFLAPLGAAQKAIKSFTGDTLSLKNTIANLALGFAIFVSQGLDGLAVLGLEFQALFNRVIAQLFAKIARAAAEFRTELANLPDDVKAVLPGVGLLEKAIGKVADGAGSIGRKFAEGAAEFSEKAKLLAEENAFTVAGLQEQINRNANQPGQGALLFDDPLSALSTSVEPLKKDIEESLRAGTADGITKGIEDAGARALPRLGTLGEEAGRKLSEGISKARADVAELELRKTNALRQQGLATLRAVEQAEDAVLASKQEATKLVINEKASELEKLEIKRAQTELGEDEKRTLDKRIEAARLELQLLLRKLGLEKEAQALEQAGRSKQESAQGNQPTGGPEFGNVTEGINELQRNANEAAQQIDQALLAALIVDPKDESKIINSFSDLLTNIQDLFKENPLGFVLTLFGGKGFFGQGQQGGTGFARGGLLDSARASRAQASAAHYAHPHGFARGGMPRPRGLDPRDRVPVWSRIGEYFIRPEAVQLYGKRFFDAVNSGALEPAPMRALASVTPGVMGRLPTVPGFAQGGAVSSLPSGGGNGPIQAVMAPDERTVAALLSAGKQTFRDWLQEEGYRPV